MTTGEIVLYIAASVDGFVAAEDGSVAWLEEFQSSAANGATRRFSRTSRRS